ncbi:MAG: amidoligase family protein [bacterium]|nr:amidoligase family protein [bacterium]
MDIIDFIKYSNNLDNKKKLLEQINALKYNINLFNDYTFGIEFEFELINQDKLKYLNYPNILNNWVVKDEQCNEEVLEISSPILNYDMQSLKEVKLICDIITNKMLGYTSDECGCHIHIGFDVFKKAMELKNLYTIYCNNENIFYLMSNKCNSEMRRNVKYYANPMSVKIENYINNGYFDNENDLFNFVQKMKIIQKDRFNSINIFNAFSIIKNTIEFRCPNGELDYNEILLNIILYLKLIDASKKGISSDEINFFISDEVNEESKKDVLLNLLFEDNSQLIELFNDRYETNYEANQKVNRLIRYKSKVLFK